MLTNNKDSSSFSGNRLVGPSSSSSSCISAIPQERYIVSNFHPQHVTSLTTSDYWRKNNSRIPFLRDFMKLSVFNTLISQLPSEPYQKISYMATIVENGLFIDAASEDDYTNMNTLNKRVTVQLNKYIERKLSQQVYTSIRVQSSDLLHAWPNGTVVEPTSQKLVGPIINATNYGTPPVFNSNTYGFLEGSGPLMVSSCAARNPQTSSWFPQQQSDDLEMRDVIKERNCLKTINKNESVALPTAVENNQSASFKKFRQPCGPRYQTMMNYEQPQHPTRLLKEYEQFTSGSSQGLIGFDGSACGKDEAILPLKKRRKEDPAFDEFLNDNSSFGLWTHQMVHPYSSKEIPELQQQAESPFSFFNVEGHRNPLLDPMDKIETKNNVIDDTLGQTFESETLCSQDLKDNHSSEESVLKSQHGIASSNSKENVIGLKSLVHTLCIDPIDAEIEDIHWTTEFNSTRENAEKTDIELKADEENKTKYSNATVNHISEESEPKIHDVIASSNLEENVISLNCAMDTLSKDLTDADMEDVQGRTEFNLGGENVKDADIELKANQEKETKFPTETVNFVALTEFFSLDQLRKLRREGRNEKERGSADDSCQICGDQKKYFAPVKIYCSSCGTRIKQNAVYYLREAEELFDTKDFICNSCYKNSRGDIVTINETSFGKKLLVKMTNDDVSEEAWVECNKCKGWEHQICALYNSKRDLDRSGVYICPECRIEDIESGKHVPLPKTANFGAKDLPRTKLSDHIENRLFKRLMQERADTAKVEGKNNPNEVLAAENLFVRVVSSVDKQLKVKKEFLDIFSDEYYPSEFLYRSKLILLFQNTEGVDICLFGMYVQEFGSECGLPNQRCVYISFLDSCKYFKPDRKTATGEALRTYVYHEIMIGYLDYCKKRGFTTCYLFACPPKKGEDYILYCRPENQKIPNDDRLRRWYHSMLRKASEENIVVGLTNIYDHFFVPTRKCDSKVTAACLPYFDGDYWSAKAVELALEIEQESQGHYVKQLKTLRLTKRSLKAMGHCNPSKDTAKDILVMQKLREFISSSPNNKEDFIVIHLQHSCMHCHEVIVSGKRWFCTECKNFQECDRCHTANSHSTINGEKHRLRQALIDDIPFDTKENDITVDNEFLENRIAFLSFCQNQENKLQFDTLRRAKYSTMMIIYQLQQSPSVLL